MGLGQAASAFSRDRAGQFVGASSDDTGGRFVGSSNSGNGSTGNRARTGTTGRNSMMGGGMMGGRGGMGGMGGLGGMMGGFGGMGGMMGGRGGMGGRNNMFGFNNQSSRNNRSVQVRTQLQVDFAYPQTTATAVTNQLETRLNQVSSLGRQTPLSVAVEQGEVTLRGQVATEEDRTLAIQLAKLEPGVKTVRDELTVVSSAASAVPLQGPQPLP